MSQAMHIGREQTVQALGRTWTVSRWTRARWTEYLEWARTQVPDPVEVALRKLDRFPRPLQDVIVCHAHEMANQYLAINSPEVQRLMSSFEGAVQLLYFLLRPRHPDIDIDTATDIALELGEAELRRATEKAAGKVEGGSGNSQAPAD